MDRITVERIDHVAINVTDLARAKAFYAQLLGLPEIPRPATFTFPGAWYRVGSVDLHLVGRDQLDPESRRHFALWVADVHGAAHLLAQAGYPVDWDRTRIPGVDRFFTRDPDHNRIEIQGQDRTSEQPHPSQTP